MAISMLKIRRPLGRLIFNMGIAIPGKTVFLIETAPRAPSQYADRLSQVWDSHVKDETVLRRLFFLNVDPYTGKTASFYHPPPNNDVSNHSSWV